MRPAVSFTPAGDRIVLAAGSLGGGLRTLDTSNGTEILDPIEILGARASIRDEIYWTGADTFGLPTGGNVLTFDLASALTPIPA